MVRNPEENPELMKAVEDYLSANGLALPDNAEFGYMIDGVYVDVDNETVLTIGLPPVSNYPVRKTEYTDRYLLIRKPAAV